MCLAIASVIDVWPALGMCTTQEKPAGSSKRAAAPEDALTLLRKLAPRPELLFKVVQVRVDCAAEMSRLCR